ncbi:MAG: tRNA (adenosine(37)-N6)-threonylcarbamoyltransferase complex ATPase subunit type 1 TsaE [Acidobacteriota bacterium]|nr:tRNA (adenosine(37)-N6)-threonylcarbamoyltransferase complex ATPase subunit type 1 TsaE [Acidobacteriota bacterium]
MSANETQEILSHSAPETERAGKKLGSTLSARDVVYLEGDLGAGKTCFARGLAEGLGARPSEVASPTFAIVNEYVRPDGSVALRHLDLYRIADQPRELESIGVPDALAGAPVAVEWPRKAVKELLPPTVEVVIEVAESDSRRIRVRRLAS